MDMKGEQLIPLEQERTWQALHDVDVLRAAVPGCEQIERVSDVEYQVTVQTRIGPVAARFRGKMTVRDVSAPHGYTLAFDGQGAAGFAKGEARVELTPDGPQTLLRYTARASIGGKIAQIGSRLVDGAARKMADQFFTAFREHVSGRGA
jgi:carbon monoxide dehydrogenase subunit G